MCVIYYTSIRVAYKVSLKASFGQSFCFTFYT